MGLIDSVRNAAKSFGEKMGGLGAATDKLKSLGETISNHRITNGIKVFAKESYEKYGRDNAIKLIDEISAATREKGSEAINLIARGQTHDQIKGSQEQKNENENKNEKTNDDREME